VVDRARQLMDDWIVENVKTNRPRHQQDASPSMVDAQQWPEAHARWQKPQPGIVKCNIDAAFNSYWNWTGIGICVQDDDVAYMQAKTLSISSMTSVDVGEALGLFHVPNGYKICRWIMLILWWIQRRRIMHSTLYGPMIHNLAILL